MSQSTCHTVVLSKNFSEENYAWLKRHVLSNKDKEHYFLACGNLDHTTPGMIRCENILTGSSEGEVSILLPIYAVVGVFLDQPRKNPLGFQKNEPQSPSKEKGTIE